jgi:hypothetical protein
VTRCRTSTRVAGCTSSPGAPEETIAALRCRASNTTYAVNAGRESSLAFLLSLRRERK